MLSTTTTVALIVISGIILWLAFLVLDAIFGFFVFRNYTPPPLDHAFQPTAQ